MLFISKMYCLTDSMCLFHPNIEIFKPLCSQPTCLVNKHKLLLETGAFVSFRGLAGVWMAGAVLSSYASVILKSSTLFSRCGRWALLALNQTGFSLPSGVSLWCRQSCVTSVGWILKTVCWHNVKHSQGTWHLDLSQSLPSLNRNENCTVAKGELLSHCY